MPLRRGVPMSRHKRRMKLLQPRVEHGLVPTLGVTNPLPLQCINLETAIAQLASELPSKGPAAA